MSVELLVEKYRPQTMDEYVWQNPAMRAKAEEWIANGALPHLLLSGVSGTGKAQPLDSRVLTPTGWVLMGDLKIGDMVRTPSGRLSPVVGIFPQGKKQIFEIEFDDGKKARSCAEHLWEVRHSDYRLRTETTNKGVRILPLDAIAEKLAKLDSIKTNHRLGVRLCEPVDFYTDTTSDKLLIDPYVLGCLLGDGCLSEKGSVAISSADQELLDKFSSKLPTGMHLSFNDGYDYRIISYPEYRSHVTKKGEFTNPLKHALSELELLGKHSWDKFIPETYKFARLSDRIELLHGLMDTDGTVCGNGGAISYTTVSKQLAKDVQNLIWSLGGIAKITTKTKSYSYKKEKKIGRLAYSVNIRLRNPNIAFSLSRKKDRCPIYHQYSDILCNNIKAIRALPEHVEMQCIMIDDPEHLYITDDYVPTHNTSLAKLLLKMLGIPAGDILTIYASRERKIDEVQDRIVNFASTWSLNETGFKYVILDEADSMSMLTQKFLRGEMEAPGGHTRYILTCNYPQKILPAIHGRVQEIKFLALDRDDFVARVGEILVKEDIEFEVEDLLGYVDMTYPDLRKCIGLVQKQTLAKKLLPVPSNEEQTGGKDYLIEMVNLFKAKRFIDARNLIVSQAQVEEYTDIFRYFYRNLDLWGPHESQQDDALLAIRRALVNHAIVADPEINLAALLVELARISRASPTRDDFKDARKKI